MLDAISIFGESNSSKELDNMIIYHGSDKQITVEFVKKFIHEHGRVYDYDIRKALEEFDVDMDSIKALVNKRRSMYERLSKLWFNKRKV